ncbi:cold-shock protein [Streptomyces olivaceoviridis]
MTQPSVTSVTHVGRTEVLSGRKTPLPTGMRRTRGSVASLRRLVMVAGRVVRFDSVRGYGFLAPEHGGEDVFLHVNDLRFPEHHLRPGLTGEFAAEQGERGLKASDVRLTGTGGDRVAHVPALALVPAAAEDASAVPWAAAGEPDEQVCDLLGTAEYRHEVTETLLAAVPSLTGEQIRQVRAALVELGQSHGWVGK